MLNILINVMLSENSKSSCTYLKKCYYKYLICIYLIYYKISCKLGTYINFQKNKISYLF